MVYKFVARESIKIAIISGNLTSKDYHLDLIWAIPLCYISIAYLN